MPSPDSDADGEFQSRARLSGWLRDHAGPVRGFVLALVRRSDVADDIVQEVFCRAWQARDRYQETGSVRGYLLRIADRLVCDRGRTGRREIGVNEVEWERIEPVGDDDPARSAVDAERQLELSAALDRLSPAQQRVLLLRYYGDLDFLEIARLMDIPLNTALSHCHRGLAALRKQLAERDAQPIATTMNSPHDEADLKLRLERITAAVVPLREDVGTYGELEQLDAELREAWLGLTQTLAAHAPRDAAHLITAASVIDRAEKRAPIRSATRREAKASSWPWILAGSVLLCAIGVGELAIPRARQNVPTNAQIAKVVPPEDTDSPADAASDLTWDDALDDLVVSTASDTAALWQSLDDGEPTEMSEALGLIEEELEASTL